MSSFAKRTQKLLDTLRLLAVVEKRLEAPGFSHALALNHDKLSPSQFLPPADGSHHAFTFEYKIPLQLTLPFLSPHSSNVVSSSHKTTPTISLSTLLAILDDVTSWSTLLGDPKRRRFGVSVNLRAEWAQQASSFQHSGLLHPGQTLHISTTNSKIGKNIAFIDAQVFDAQTEDLVAFGSHIKYLDMGKLMNFVLSEQGWPMLERVVTKMNESALATQLLRNMLPYEKSQQTIPTDHEYQLLHLFDSIKFQEESPTTRATFQPEHFHASMGGRLHGGCQAILMELVGSYAAQHELDVPNVMLEAMQIDYLSTPSSRSHVDLIAETLSPNVISQEVPISSNQQKTLSVQTKIITRGKIVSKANLRFSSGDSMK